MNIITVFGTPVDVLSKPDKAGYVWVRCHWRWQTTEETDIREIMYHTLRTDDGFAAIDVFVKKLPGYETIRRQIKAGLK